MSIPSVPTKIWLALKNHLQGLRINGQTIDMALPAQPYQPKSANGVPQPYISVGRVSALPVRMEIGSGKKRLHEGSLSLVLVQPLLRDAAGNSVPEEAYIERAAQVAAHFPEDSRIAYGGICLRVLTTPAVQDGYQDAGYWRIPVKVDWRTIA